MLYLFVIILLVLKQITFTTLEAIPFLFAMITVFIANIVEYRFLINKFKAIIVNNSD